MDTSAPTHVNPPQQSRSQRTLERLVRASLEILDEAGPAALTVQSVVARANSSVGSFYARFKGKDDLLDYLGERVWQEALDRWNASVAARDWSELELRQMVEGSVGLLVEARQSHASLKSLDRAAGRNDDAYLDFRRQLRDAIAALLLTRTDAIDHEDPELAVRLGLTAVLGLVESAEDSDGASLPEGVLVHEATEILVGYLSPTRGIGDTGGVDFFDVWG